MLIKGLNECDTVNYKKTSMFIIFPNCDFKCCKEAGCNVCQNSLLAEAPIIEVPIEKIVNLYMKNPLSRAIVCGGLEPFDSYPALMRLIAAFRAQTDDDIVIYTGYKDNENTLIELAIKDLKQYKNIIIKFGRFIPNQTPHYDSTLGVKLSSNNQYARKIS